MGKSLCVSRKLANGELKKYYYDKIGGIPIREYQKEAFRVNHVPKGRIPKHERFPEDVQKMIQNLHVVGIGVERIVKLLHLQYPETRIGTRSVKSFLYSKTFLSSSAIA